MKKKNKKKLPPEERPGMSEGGMRALCQLPALLLLLAIVILPLLATLVLSFSAFDPAIAEKPVFVGVENYRALFDRSSDEVLAATSATGITILVAVSAQTVLGFGLALLLRRRFFGRGLLFSLLLIPLLLSPAVIATFWRYLSHPDFGLLPWAAGELGLPVTLIHRWACLGVETWIWTPFMMLLCLAGMSRIPESVYEAAVIDRASAWFRFCHITLPRTAPLVLLGVLFRVADSIRIFDTALSVRPDLQSLEATSLSVLLYRQAFYGDVGFGVAAALTSLIALVAIVIACFVIHQHGRVRRLGG
ncbi:MAG: sugar ABC transporter permease [Planctomycetota bacterium]